MKKRMPLLLLVSVLVFGGVLGLKWFSTKMMNEFIDNMPIPPVSINSVQVERQRWVNKLKAVGTLVAVNGADLTAEAEGRVTAIYFESGDVVEKGQLLLKMESAAEQGELDRLKAQEELADLNRRRQADLYKRGTISKSQYDTALAELRAASASVAAQQGRLELKTVVAPFSGTLGLRRITVGQHLRSGDQIATLQALDPIELDFSLPERDLGAVASGMAVLASIDAFGNEEFVGEILATEPKIDPQTRNFDIRARLPNPDSRLKPGIFANVTVNLGEDREVLVIPLTAVQYTSYGDSVFVIQQQENPPAKPTEPNPMAPAYTDLEVSQHFVQLGEQRGDFIEVVKGLEEGERVASSGLLKLRGGQPVIIENELQPVAELHPSPAQN